MVNLSAASRTNRSRSVVVSPDEQHGFGVKYWEIIADNLKKRGWSYGYVSAVDSQGRTIWIVDAHRDDGKRYVVRDSDSGFKWQRRADDLFQRSGPKTVTPQATEGVSLGRYGIGRSV